MAEPHIVVPVIDQAAAIMRLRTAVFREEAALAGASQPAIAQHTSDWLLDDEVRDYAANYMSAWLNDAKVFYRIVLQDSAVVGLCLAQKGTEQTGHNYVAVVQLAPAIRRRGVGRRLMAEFEKMADPGLPVRLHVYRGNKAAISFYRQLGFSQTGEPETRAIGGDEVAVLVMQKPARV